MDIYIGTSGWSYKSWEGEFYPSGITSGEHFAFYVTQFPTVEINLTFYRLPTLKMVQRWNDVAPREFLFAVKGSRFITHLKKLTNLDGALKKYFDRLKPLKQKVAVVLWQLPPFLRLDPERLRRFLKVLPGQYAHAVEFRHPSWLIPETFKLLREFRVAHVSVSSQAMPRSLAVTSPIIYIRFHGLAGGAAHDYTRAELVPWAEHIREQAEAGRKVFAYFNNDASERAPANAKLLTAMVRDQDQESVQRAAKYERPLPFR